MQENHRETTKHGKYFCHWDRYPPFRRDKPDVFYHNSFLPRKKSVAPINPWESICKMVPFSPLSVIGTNSYNYETHVRYKRIGYFLS